MLLHLVEKLRAYLFRPNPVKHTRAVIFVFQFSSDKHITSDPTHKLCTEVSGVNAIQLGAAQLNRLTFCDAQNFSEKIKYTRQYCALTVLDLDSQALCVPRHELWIKIIQICLHGFEAQLDIIL
jgi:hypothetical protein